MIWVKSPEEFEDCLKDRWGFIDGELPKDYKTHFYPCYIDFFSTGLPHDRGNWGYVNKTPEEARIMRLELLQKYIVTSELEIQKAKEEIKELEKG